MSTRMSDLLAVGVIGSFSGEHLFLSNFYPAVVSFMGHLYPTVEHAYQAAKADTQNERYRDIVRTTHYPGRAKALGKSLEAEGKLRKDWKELNVGIMRALLEQKFQDGLLRAALLRTAPRSLIEGNYWHDNFWGVCTCRACPACGDNKLGKLLMTLRAEYVGYERDWA